MLSYTWPVHRWWVCCGERGVAYIDLLTSGLLRRTSSVFSSTSQPFSACDCRREYRLLGTLPELLCAASTVQHSTAQSTRTSSKASTRRSERDNAGEQTGLARSSMSSRHLYRSLRSRNERRNRNLPGLQEHPTIVTVHEAA